MLVAKLSIVTWKIKKKKKKKKEKMEEKERKKRREKISNEIIERVKDSPENFILASFLILIPSRP